MITVDIVRSSTRYVSIGAAFHDSAGALTDPTSPTVDVLRVTPSTGARVAIGGSPFTLTKVNPPNLTGMYSVSIDIDGLSEGQYECYVRGDVGGNVGGTVVNLVISAPISDILVDTNEIQGKLPSGTISDFDESTDRVNLSVASETQIDDIETAIAALSIPTAAAIADQVWEEAVADHSGVAGSSAEMLTAIKTQVDDINNDIGSPTVSLADDISALASGIDSTKKAVWIADGEVVADGGNTAQVFKTDLPFGVGSDDFINGHLLIVWGGANTGMARRISDYDGATKIVTLESSLDSTPAPTDDITVASAAGTVNLSSVSEGQIDTIDTAVAALPTAADIADAVLDEVMSGHTTVGTLGLFLSEIHQVETGRWKIDENTNTMVFYDTDGVTPLKTFNLKDVSGAASTVNVYERTPV